MNEHTTHTTEPPMMKDFHCRNHDCRAILGTTNGFQLICGENAVFTLRVTIICRKCGQVRMWRPILGVKPISDIMNISGMPVTE